MFNVAVYCLESLNECHDYSIEVKANLPSLVPDDSVFTLDAIECGIYTLNDMIECHIGEKLQWEKIIELFGSMQSALQLELIEGTADDTDVRERILSQVSLSFTGMNWPTYGLGEEHQSKWKETFVKELKLYLR